MKMNKLIFMALLVSSPLTAQDTQTLPALEQEIVDAVPADVAFAKVENYFNVVTSLKARFRQVNPNGTIARGNMLLRRPGKIRFDYEDDYPFLIVSDGRTLNLVDFEIGKVSKWPVSDTPLKMLLGSGIDLAELGARVEINPGGAQGFIAVTAGNPKKREQGEITLFFLENANSAGGLILDSWQVLDGQGKVTQVTLDDQQANAEMDASVWTFDDPRATAKRNRTKRR